MFTFFFNDFAKIEEHREKLYMKEIPSSSSM